MMCHDPTGAQEASPPEHQVEAGADWGEQEGDHEGGLKDQGDARVLGVPCPQELGLLSEDFCGGEPCTVDTRSRNMAYIYIFFYEL